MIRILLFVELARYHTMKFVEQTFRFRFALPLHGLSHHAGRSFPDRAARAFKTDVVDSVAFDLKIDVQLITTERIETLRRPVRRFQLMKIARLLVVIEDDCLVKLAQFRHQSNTSMTFSIASANRSTSSRVL